ncbi:hypothetical protein I4U23_005673 [Adineta vaga]|nr:hypothetical protein I4U23_005673 [Adineta vaga]
MMNAIRTQSFVSVFDSLESDIIIDTTKGFVLRRLGDYSPNLVKQIVHTFLPLHNFCIASSNSDVCVYDLEHKNVNVLEIGTIMSSRESVHTLSSFHKNNISKLINDDLNHILMHQHDKSFPNNKSIFHYFKKQFFCQKQMDKSTLTSTLESDGLSIHTNIPRARAVPAEIILQHITNNKIDFDYLSNDDLHVLLTAVLSPIDSSNTIYDIQKSLNEFSELIIGQSVFVMRNCLKSTTNLVSTQPCLVMSTLFLEIPADSITKFSVFQVIPLPFIFNYEKYTYINLPKAIGMNTVDNKLVLWNDEFDYNECTFSRIVICKKKPISFILRKYSCLHELFNHQLISNTKCSLTRSQDIDQNLLQIDDGIFFFYNIENTIYCKISYQNGTTETISVNETGLIRLPCDMAITCTNFQLPITTCSGKRIHFLHNPEFNIEQLSSFFIPVKGYEQVLREHFKIQAGRPAAQPFSRSVALPFSRCAALPFSSRSAVQPLCRFAVPKPFSR